MLYTRTGDGGTSRLFDSATRIAKNDAIFDALGTVDELNSLIGLARARLSSLRRKWAQTVATSLLNVQEHLFILQAELAGASKRLDSEHVHWLEKTIATLEERVRNPHSFVVPGATEYSAILDYARAVSRRAERCVLSSRAVRELSAPAYVYMNRLSSLLYALARFAALSNRKNEQKPVYY